MANPRLQDRESLTIEFKSDRPPLSDHDMVEAAICFANADGGTIYLGVEDDGRVTGLHPQHQDVGGLVALISNRTVPPLSVRARLEQAGQHRYLAVEVPRSDRPVATSGGTLLRRRLKADGEPECTPFYPHEWPRRAADLGQLDYSALPMTGVSPDDLDPLERVRLRQAVERYGGDRALLGLADNELDGALGLVRREGEARLVTVAGLLLLGRSDVLRRHIPTHEVAFQVLEGTDVAVNEFLRDPLLRTFERVQDLFGARVTEEEIQVGLFRVPIPTFDRRSFREAFINAISHRDYTRLGAVHCRWEGDTLSLSNPGGFVEGVTLDNLLVVEPRPRNPTLADALKRIGLAERTGRGVDLIYQGLLRYGRPVPDYGRSDRHTVVVRLSGRGGPSHAAPHRPGRGPHWGPAAGGHAAGAQSPAPRTPCRCADGCRDHSGRRRPRSATVGAPGRGRVGRGVR